MVTPSNETPGLRAFLSAWDCVATALLCSVFLAVIAVSGEWILPKGALVLHIVSFALVLGGSVSFFRLHHPSLRFFRMLKETAQIRYPETDRMEALADHLVEVADVGVKRGAAALMSLAERISEPSLRLGLQLIADSCAEEWIRHQLLSEQAFMTRRHDRRYHALRHFSRMLPLSGSLTAVTFLFSSLSRHLPIEDTSLVASNVGATLVPLFYGVFLGAVCSSFVERLHDWHERESHYKQFVTEGILVVQTAIRESLPPVVTRRRLANLLATQRRQNFIDEARIAVA